jgi:type 1 glutamine amidotransferase
MQKLVLLSSVLLFLFSNCPNSYNDKHILIYTKNGEGYVHDNIQASVEALTEICTELGMTVEDTNDPAVFTKEKLKTVDAIIFSNTNNEAFDTQSQRTAFVNFIQSGGGFVGIHSACASERQWPWFWAMVGGKFVRHPKFQPFTIRVIDSTHISTEFLNETWEWEDECYYLDHLNPDIHVLLAVDLRTVEDPEQEKYPGKVFGDLFPVAWYHEYDGGKQFYTALGHKIEHYADPTLRKHLKGGILWTLK